jgi:hypothetical protein
MGAVDDGGVSHGTVVAEEEEEVAARDDVQVSRRLIEQCNLIERHELDHQM